MKGKFDFSKLSEEERAELEAELMLTYDDLALINQMRKEEEAREFYLDYLCNIDAGEDEEEEYI